MRWMVRTTKKHTNANFLKWNSEAKGYSPDSWETFVHGDLFYSKTASRDREDIERQFKLTLLGGLFTKDAMVQLTMEETARDSSAVFSIIVEE
jgi:hypothetical protein